MKALYNEIDPAAATWLENLIADGLIADGDVCRTSIADLRPSDLAGYTQVHFFAGIGGWSFALRMAGWPDALPVWTGSCPCQPFSLAGKQKGFDDDRHLWPHFRNLIGQCRPPVVFGEQVASATQWLGLVRSDLEAMEYAVGCMPIEAASAGADHLRDRYWFVGHCQGERRGEGRPEHVVRSGRDAAASDGGSIDVADCHVERPQGRLAMRECADQRLVGPDGVADADKQFPGEGWLQRSGQFSGPSGDSETRGCGPISNTEREGSFSTSHGGIHCEQESVGSRHVDVERHGAPRSDFQWVIGADGKARRVKSGIRLLAHGIPGRVAKLRGFGNAIDPRPAAAFIRASGLFRSAAV